MSVRLHVVHVEIEDLRVAVGIAESVLCDVPEGVTVLDDVDLSGRRDRRLLTIRHPRNLELPARTDDLRIRPGSTVGLNNVAVEVPQLTPPHAVAEVRLGERPSRIPGTDGYGHRHRRRGSGRRLLRRSRCRHGAADLTDHVEWCREDPSRRGR